MSKRFGNVLTVRDLREEGVDPAALRLLFFNTHYRQQLNFTDEALEGAMEGVRRLGDFRDRLTEAAAAAERDSVPEAAETFRRGFREALDDDLNAPEALGALFGFVRAGHRALDVGDWDAPAARAALDVVHETMAVLDLLPSAVGVAAELERWVERKIAERQAAREAGDYAAADAIREEVGARGVELEDTPEGTRWRSRRPGGPSA